MGADADDVRAQLRQRLQQDPRQELRERLGPAEQTDPWFDEFLAEGARTALNNILGLPGAMAAGFDPDGEVSQRLGTVGEGAFQKPTEGFTRMPTASELEAAGRSIPALVPGGQSPGERFTQEQLGVDARIRGSRAEHPMATTFGDITGDIATLLGGRQPIARLVQRAETRAVGSRPSLYFGRATPEAARNLEFVWQRTANTPAMRKLYRGLGRSAETGFEAAVLESLKGDDPLESAAWAAGGQLGGSALLEGMKHLFTGGPVSAAGKLTIAAATTGGLMQLLKSASPGGQDYILESLESGFDKVKWGLALGVLSGAAGAGRLRDTQWADRFPEIMDAIAATPRGFSLSILEEWRDGDDQTKARIEQRLQELSQGQVEAENAERLLESPGQLGARRGSVSGVIDRETTAE